MNIVVTDGYTLNPGDLSWDEIKKFGNLTIYDRTTQDQLIDRVKDAQIVLTNKTLLTADTINKLDKLRYIGVLATGYNVVDIEAAKKKNIVVTNIPAYGTNSVAEMVFALIMELSRHIQTHDDAVHSGQWTNGKDFCFWNKPQIELAGKTIGIVGLGKIGMQVGKIADAFNMNVIASDKIKTNTPQFNSFKWAEIPQVLAQSDIISLHTPLTPETQGLINRQTLALMKKNAFLINTSRGPLLVDTDLADALNNEQIAGAGLDVLSVEPPASDNPLLKAKNCIITPHIAWATFEARSRLMDIVAVNIKSYLEEKPANVVNS